MPSYFYKDSKNRTWQSSVMKVILVISQRCNLQRFPSIMFSLCQGHGRRVTRAGEGGEVCPVVFQILEKIVQIWSKKCPDCVNLWVKFLI